MKTTILSGIELDARAAEEWSRIQCANPDLQSPYFCPGFTKAVASVRDDVRIAVSEDGGRPIAFFPFQDGKHGRGGPVGGRLSDYQGVIVARNDGWDAAGLIRAARLSWWDFDHLLCAQTPFAAHHLAVAGSPYIDLSQGFAAYAEERKKAGSKQIKSLEALRRKLEREAGTIRFVARTTDSAVLARLLEWKSDQCRRGEGADIFGVRWTNALVERLLDTDEPGFAGVLSALYAGDTLLAAHFGMRSSTVWHYWFPSYSHEHSKYSPGLLLLLEMAKSAESSGIKTIDMGKGDAPYKERFRSGIVPIAEGRVVIPSAASSVRECRERVETWARSSSLAAPLRASWRRLRRLGRGNQPG